ncbi:MAG TPA: orange carotenoid protein N-terminal domain-containing protein [Stenomitos sp.]
MTTDSISQHSEITSSFGALSTDQKLALLWFIYEEVGKSITPAAPGASTASPAVAEGLFQQVLGMSHEEQLQLQRDIVDCKDGTISREYGALSDTTKLLFWYLLAQGMDRKEVIPMPEGYELEPAAQNCLQQLQSIPYNEQITVLRDFVAPMGSSETDI